MFGTGLRLGSYSVISAYESGEPCAAWAQPGGVSPAPRPARVTNCPSKPAAAHGSLHTPQPTQPTVPSHTHHPRCPAAAAAAAAVEKQGRHRRCVPPPPPRHNTLEPLTPRFIAFFSVMVSTPLDSRVMTEEAASCRGGGGAVSRRLAGVAGGAQGVRAAKLAAAAQHGAAEHSMTGNFPMRRGSPRGAQKRWWVRRCRRRPRPRRGRSQPPPPVRPQQGRDGRGEAGRLRNGVRSTRGGGGEGGGGGGGHTREREAARTKKETCISFICRPYSLRTSLSDSTPGMTTSFPQQHPPGLAEAKGK